MIASLNLVFNVTPRYRIYALVNVLLIFVDIASNNPTSLTTIVSIQHHVKILVNVSI